MPAQLGAVRHVVLVPGLLAHQSVASEHCGDCNAAGGHHAPALRWMAFGDSVSQAVATILAVEDYARAWTAERGLCHRFVYTDGDGKRLHRSPQRLIPWALATWASFRGLRPAGATRSPSRTTITARRAVHWTASERGLL